jgi:hypothetical protein
MILEPVNQAAILGAGQALVPDYAKQLLQQRMAGVQEQEAQTQANQEARLRAGAQREQERQQGFSTALDHVLRNPTKDGIDHVVSMYPEFHEPARRVWETREKRGRDHDFRQMNEIFSAGAGGRWDLAEKVLQARVDADKAAGNLDDTDDEMLAMIKTGDPEERRRALGMVGYQIAAVDGLDRFGPTLDKLLPVTEGQAFEKYARAQGLKPGTEEYNRAMQDYVLRGNGPTATDLDVELEGVRQGNRERLEGVRQGGRASLEQVRQGNRIALEGAKEGNRRSRPVTQKQPNVLERIRAKMAVGQPLTPGEQRVYNDAQSRGRGGSGAGRAGSSAVIVNPQTGQRLQLQGGKWVPVK